MPYDITYRFPEYSPNAGNDGPAIQPWSFDPEDEFTLEYLIGSPFPDPITLQVGIKDYYLLFKDDYDEILARMGQSNPYLFDRSQPVIETTSPFTLPIDLNGFPSNTAYLLDGTNLDVDVDIDFINFSVLPEGTYRSILSFVGAGRDTASGSTQTLDYAFFYDLFVKVLPQDSYVLNPKQLGFVHVIDEAFPVSKLLKISVNGDFTIAVPDYISLSGGNIVNDGTVDGYTSYSGTDSQDLQVVLNAQANNLQVGSYELPIKFTKLQPSKYAELPLVVVIYADDTVLVDPAALEFTAISGVSESVPQTVRAYGPGVMTASAPPWLNVSVSEGFGYYEFTVNPIDSDNMAPGTYQNVVTITRGADTFEVLVTLFVFDNVKLGMASDALNYTGDRSAISYFYDTNDYKLKLDLAIAFYNYGSTIINKTTIPIALGFFNNTSSFWCGQSIGNVMRELRELSAINLQHFANQLSNDSLLFVRHYYTPAQLDLNILFDHKFDELLDKRFEYTDLKFIKGRKPKGAFANSAILDYYRDTLRVTVNSVALFSFYKEEVHTVRVFKNGVLHKSLVHNPGTQRLFSIKQTFEDFAEGDVIEMRLHKNLDQDPDEAWYNDPENYVAQKYIVFPEGKASIHIAWEKEYGVLDCLEFTGSATFAMDIESNLVNSFEDFKEVLRKIDTTKKQRLVANTGIILKDNVKRIESLLEAKRAWVISKEDKLPIDLVPITKKLSGSDTDRGIYEYDVEFEINPNDADESYI